MGCTAKAHCDQPSVKDPSHLSVISDPIEGGEATPENYFDLFKSFLVDTMGATELPDGTILEERSAQLDLLGIGVKSYAKHILKKDENHGYCYEYGTDESLSEMLSVTHVQVH